MPGAIPLQRLVPALIHLLLVLPCVLVGLSWWSLVQPSMVRRRATLLEPGLLVLVSLSQALLMWGLWSPAAIGPDYSSRRFATIAINLAVMVGTTVVVVIAARRARGLLASSAACVACSWGYVAMVSSAV